MFVSVIKNVYSVVLFKNLTVSTLVIFLNALAPLLVAIGTTWWLCILGTART